MLDIQCAKVMKRDETNNFRFTYKNVVWTTKAQHAMARFAGYCLLAYMKNQFGLAEKSFMQVYNSCTLHQTLTKLHNVLMQLYKLLFVTKVRLWKVNLDRLSSFQNNLPVDVHTVGESFAVHPETSNIARI